MAGFIKDWIINIIALVLFIVLIEIIMPSGKTRKYVNLVTGFILLIAIINPIVKLFKGNISLVNFQLAGSAEVQRLEIEKTSSLYKKEQMKQIVEVYRQKVIKQLERSAMETEGVAEAEADVIINEDYTSENFGELKRAYINIVPKIEGEKTKPVDNVKIVRVRLEQNTGTKNDINSGSSGADHEADSGQIEAKVRREIEDKVEKLFNLHAENVVVGLLER